MYCGGHSSIVIQMHGSSETTLQFLIYTPKNSPGGFL